MKKSQGSLQVNHWAVHLETATQTLQCVRLVRAGSEPADFRICFPWITQLCSVPQCLMLPAWWPSQKQSRKLINATLRFGLESIESGIVRFHCTLNSPWGHLKGWEEVIEIYSFRCFSSAFSFTGEHLSISGQTLLDSYPQWTSQEHISLLLGMYQVAVTDR